MLQFPIQAGLAAWQVAAPMPIFACRAGTRFYRVHVPRNRPGRPRGLILLLHGCGQRAERFAAESGVEAEAARQGWITVTPQQSRRKNVLGCWNWFEADHRARKGGEVEILAALARQVAAQHGVPAGAIFVAGFSAGAAMALALADAYPELFAAACVHSGVHYAGIRDGEAATAAMRGDFAGPAPGARRRGVPVLVIQGTADSVVHPANARRITSGRGRRDRLVMLRGGGHEWAEGAAAETVAFFRRHTGAAGARELGARLGGMVRRLRPPQAAVPLAGSGRALARLGEAGPRRGWRGRQG